MFLFFCLASVCAHILSMQGAHKVKFGLPVPPMLLVMLTGILILCAPEAKSAYVRSTSLPSAEYLALGAPSVWACAALVVGFTMLCTCFALSVMLMLWYGDVGETLRRWVTQRWARAEAVGPMKRAAAAVLLAGCLVPVAQALVVSLRTPGTLRSEL